MEKTQQPQPTVLISGVSVAGPALAYWLVRYGFAVTLVEQAPALRPGGYAVDVRGAAIEVIDRMGILKQVQAADTAMQGMYLVDRHGQQIAQLNDAAPGNRSGNGSVEIMRGDLAGLLYDLTKDRCTYRWGDSIATLQAGEDGVAVTFEQGPPQRFDFVMGADGLHSRVRQLTFGDEAQFVHGLGCYVSIFTVPNHLRLQNRQLVYLAPRRLVSLYSARQNTEAKAFLVFKSPLLPYSRRDVAAQKQLVVQAFADERGWEVPRLLKTLEEAPDFYFDLMAQVRLESWSRGRVALVGDAAYCASPASGQGTSLALVGAYVLAGELYQARGNYAAAFASYQHEMRTFVQQNQQLGVAIAKDMVPASALEVGVRNLIVRLPGLLPWLMKRSEREIKQAAEGIVLKSYPA
ncbi:MAG: FAD-dependent monooxygenase [Janthinobacterium lividum]